MTEQTLIALPKLHIDFQVLTEKRKLMRPGKKKF